MMKQEQQTKAFKITMSNKTVGELTPEENNLIKRYYLELSLEQLNNIARVNLKDYSLMDEIYSITKKIEELSESLEDDFNSNTCIK